MPELVKGAGFRTYGGNEPLKDQPEIMDRAFRAEKALTTSVKTGLTNPAQVRKGLNPTFASEFNLFAMPGANNGMADLASQISGVLSSELGKSITLTSPLQSGFVPFDLVAPSRLIYPIYSPYRNKLPRVPGQGTSRRAKVVTGVQGTGTPNGSNGAARVSISELNGGSLPTWPLNIPASGSQTAVDLNIPYKFLGLSEAISWLAQFAGQGFEDVAALANLILLQEMMLGEEFQIMFGTSTDVGAPTIGSIALRNAGTNETPVAAAGGGNSYYVRITAVTPFGESTMSAAAEAAVGATTGKVIDITAPIVAGATGYNVYISAAAAAGSAPSGASSYFLYASNVGGSKFTISGALPTTGTNPPTTDTTGSSNDFEGLTSILSGHAVNNSVYPAGFLGGYVNNAVGDTLNIDVVNTALRALWDAPGAYRADPAELVVEGTDAKNLADSIGAQSGNTGYRLFISQSDNANVRGGVAVSEIVNPVTRSLVKILVHPWMPQGNAHIMSYQLPQSWTNVANCWEMTVVQDYLSIAWPVIDPTFRYSIYCYETLFAGAPQYSGLLQGLQAASGTPYK